MNPEPFDVRALETYLREEGICAGAITLRRIGDGHSNLTYLVEDGGHRVVVRRPPPPPIPPGGHDVLREARIQRALAATVVPVPKILATQDAGTVMDSPFYVMDHLDGVVATTDLPAAIDDAEGRRTLAETLVDTLADLHAVDHHSVGLGDLGRASADVPRHLRRFARINDPDGGRLEGDLGDLLERLVADPPVPRETAIVHGDYRIGNVMISADAPPGIVAVLDWELATVGDPLRDLGYFLATYAVPGEPLHALTEMSTATLAEGHPSRGTLARRYARRTGRDVSHIAWYQAMALWKLAVLFEYQRRRVARGVGDPYYTRPGLVEDLISAAHVSMTGASI